MWYTFKNFYIKKTYEVYLYYVYKRLKYCKNVYELVKIYKNINFFIDIKDADHILSVIVDCVTHYPLSTERYEFFSILQQTHSETLGLENYVTLITWLAMNHAIMSTQKRLT